jgi:hypothetical protein
MIKIHHGEKKQDWTPHAFLAPCHAEGNLAASLTLHNQTVSAHAI